MSVLYKKDDEFSRISGAPVGASIDENFKKKYILDYSTANTTTSTIAYNGNIVVTAAKHCRVFISYYTSDNGTDQRNSQILYNGTIINLAGKSSAYPGVMFAGSYDVDAGDSITFKAVGESAAGNYVVQVCTVNFLA